MISSLLEIDSLFPSSLFRVYQYFCRAAFSTSRSGVVQIKLYLLVDKEVRQKEQSAFFFPDRPTDKGGRQRKEEGDIKEGEAKRRKREKTSLRGEQKEGERGSIVVSHILRGLKQLWKSDRQGHAKKRNSNLTLRSSDGVALLDENLDLPVAPWEGENDSTVDGAMSPGLQAVHKRSSPAFYIVDGMPALRPIKTSRQVRGGAALGVRCWII